METQIRFAGYRYYDAHKIEFTTGAPFGHGLSYTTFKYSAVAMEGRNVSFMLENSGKVAGAEVAQVYASLPREGLGADEPPKRLVAFEKIELDPVCTLLAHSPLFLSAPGSLSVLSLSLSLTPLPLPSVWFCLHTVTHFFIMP